MRHATLCRSVYASMSEDSPREVSIVENCDNLSPCPTENGQTVRETTEDKANNKSEQFDCIKIFDEMFLQEKPDQGIELDLSSIIT